MAKSEKDEEQKYLVELECVKLVSLRNMDKLGRPYGKKKKREMIAEYLHSYHSKGRTNKKHNLSLIKLSRRYNSVALTIEIIFIINVECKKHAKMKAFEISADVLYVP